MTCDVIDEPPTPSQAGVLGRIHRPRTPEVAYRAILPLRTRNARGIAVLVDGVDADHVATDVLT